MAKKQDSYYFETFVACVDHACKASRLLVSALREFHPETLEQRLQTIHAEEHAADQKKHELMSTLAHAFITPIEREDIVLLSQNIDTLVDQIEDVLMRTYCNNIQSIRPDALELVELLVGCTDAVKKLMEEFQNFQRLKTITPLLREIHNLEEEADKRFISCLRRLHTGSSDPVEIMVWHELYSYIEKCFDACEHIAETTEMVIMKNT